MAPAENGALELVYETAGLLGRVRVLGGNRRSALLAIDKLRPLRAAAQAGFRTPAFAVSERVDEAVAAVRGLGFPARSSRRAPALERAPDCAAPAWRLRSLRGGAAARRAVSGAGI